MNFVFILLILSVTVSACGHKGAGSKAKFKIFSGNIIDSQSVFPGGLIVMGRSIDGEQSFSSAYQPNLELVLKKGSWEFVTIGWKGSAPMEGNQQCSYQQVEINTDIFTVNFNMTYQNCLLGTNSEGKIFSDPMFYNLIGGSYNGFKKLQVKTCSNIEDCSTQSAPDSFKVEILSFFRGVTSNGGVGNSLVSNCVAGSAVSNITPPHGGTRGFIGIKVSTFNNALAKFNLPEGITRDSLGNIYVSDTSNHTIRKIDILGNITTFAGYAGISGSSDGTGTTARFSSPHGLAVDANNNIYVADLDNNTIRKITPEGVVTTLAGLAGSSGISDGTGAAARFQTPSGVVVDSAFNIFVADTANHTIRKITQAGVVTTYAGAAGTSGTTDATGAAARFSYPQGLGIDLSGNIYVADAGNHRIRKISSGAVVTTLAGNSQGYTDGVGSAAGFNSPTAISLDSSNNLYVTDLGNSTIRKITTGGVTTTIAGYHGIHSSSADGIGSAARFSHPAALVTDDAGNLLIADTNNALVRKLNISTTAVSRLAGVALSYGSNDGSASGVGCSGIPKNYYFDHGLGEVLNKTYVDGQIQVTRKAALSIDVDSTDAALALAPVKFMGGYNNLNALPSVSGPYELYINTGSAMMTVMPYAQSGAYLYYNGVSWISFPETDSVKLLLQN